MTPQNAVIMLMVWTGLAGFSVGLAAARAAMWIGHRLEQRRIKRSHPVFGFDASRGDDFTCIKIVQFGRRHGRATNAAICERDAYRAEVMLMANADAGKTANAFAAMLRARVAMRIAEGNRHG